MLFTIGAASSGASRIPMKSSSVKDGPAMRKPEGSHLEKKLAAAEAKLAKAEAEIKQLKRALKTLFGTAPAR
jgi:chromosome segregation ATPase